MDVGVGSHSVARWRRRFRAQNAAGTPRAAAAPAAVPRAAPPASAAGLEREVRALRRENEELRQQRESLSLNRSTGFLGRGRSPSLQAFLRGLHPDGVSEDAHAL